MTTTTGAAETEAFFAALEETPPTAATACTDWTAHELVAHLAAGAEELLRTLESFAAGESVPPTRPFAEREAPFRTLPDDALRTRLREIQPRLDNCLSELMAVDPDAAVPWTGRSVPVRLFATHVRSELAIHRWDMVGVDGPAEELLAQEDLFLHAMFALAPLLVAHGAPTDRPWAIRLAAHNHPTALLRTDEHGAYLEFDPGDGAEVDAVIDADPASRLLLLWGRSQGEPRRLHVEGPPEAIGVVRHALAGY